MLTLDNLRTVKAALQLLNPNLDLADRALVHVNGQLGRQSRWPVDDQLELSLNGRIAPCGEKVAVDRGALALAFRRLREDRAALIHYARQLETCESSTELTRTFAERPAAMNS